MIDEMKRHKIMALIMIVVLCLSAILLYSHQEVFKGQRIKNPDAYILDIERMNGADRHTMDLQNGDILHVQFETKRGSLYLKILSPDETIIYCGDGSVITDFIVNIQDSGVYTIELEALNAKGNIHIQCE